MADVKQIEGSVCDDRAHESGGVGLTGLRQGHGRDGRNPQKHPGFTFLLSIHPALEKFILKRFGPLDFTTTGDIEATLRERSATLAGLKQ